MRGIDCAVMENEGRKKAIKKRIYNRDLCGGGFSSRCSHAAREEGNGTGKPYNAKRGPSGAGD